MADAVSRRASKKEIPGIIIVIKPRLDYSQLFPAEQSILALRTAATDIGLTEDSPVQLHITGEVALADDELNSSLRGMELAGVLTFVLVGMVLYICDAHRRTDTQCTRLPDDGPDTHRSVRHRCRWPP